MTTGGSYNPTWNTLGPGDNTVAECPALYHSKMAADTGSDTAVVQYSLPAHYHL